jgi:predicted DNA-binding transcriptional regulator AlpA
MACALAPAAVSQKTGFAEQTLANWRVLGKGPAWFKIGRLVRYDEAEVDRWLAKFSAAEKDAA